MTTTKPQKAPAKPESKPEPKPVDQPDGYYRTNENVVVYRAYEGIGGPGEYRQHVAQGPNGELPEGLTNSDITNDE